MTHGVTSGAHLYGAGDLRWTDSPLAELASDQVRIRFGAGGICGSDLHYYRHGKSGDFVLSAPLVLGHEVSGTVEEVGADVGGLVAGDMVAVNPARPCGECANCQRGRANICDDIFFMGSASRTPHMQGGFSQYFDVRVEQCFKLSKGTQLEAAALTEPLAVALHAVERAAAASAASGLAASSTDGRGLDIAVFGAGPIGLMILLALRHAGAQQVTLIDIDDMPLSLAEGLGATAIVNSMRGGTAALRSSGFDLAIEASGSPAGLADALQSLRKGGALVQVGNLPAGTVAVPMNLIMSKELSVLGTFRFNVEFATAAELISSGTIDVSPIITARVPLAEADRGFRLALDRTTNVKVILVA